MENSAKAKINNMANVSDDILESLRKDIAEIKVALLGNEYNPTAGLLYRMNDVETKVTRLTDKYQRIMWTVVGGGTVIAIIANFIMWVVDKVVLNAPIK
jgi:hypothetical protein